MQKYSSLDSLRRVLSMNRNPENSVFKTAFQEGLRTLYHWQPYKEDRVKKMLLEQALYCSSPINFNDPWDGKPYFNTEVLNDPIELQKHVSWVVDLCRRKTKMTTIDINRMEYALQTDPKRRDEILIEFSEGMSSEISSQYRVYCLGPDPQSQLMWAHYANSHQGICLEFSLRNDVFCGAIKCQYLTDFPIMRAHENDEASTLQMLLAKSHVWEYEQEYRLIAQENEFVRCGDVLVTENNYLKFPKGALTSIIIGCQANYEEIHELVQKTAPWVKVKKAIRTPNRYDLTIEG